MRFVYIIDANPEPEYWLPDPCACDGESYAPARTDHYIHVSFLTIFAGYVSPLFLPGDSCIFSSSGTDVLLITRVLVSI